MAIRDIIDENITSVGGNAITGTKLNTTLKAMCTDYEGADTTLQGNITAEATSRANADSAINAKIPAEASSSNKLADKAYVTNAIGVETTARQAADTALTTAVNAKYTKPASGIPKTDLASGVQTSLDKADTALQSVPDTYRTAAAQDVIDNGKQATLVSGTNIKTINNQSVLGSGNLDVGSDIEVKQTTGQSTTAVMSQKAVTDELDELRADLDAIDVDNIGDARAKSIDLDELPKVCGYQMFIFGTAVPAVTPDFIGQFFIDTTNQKVYCATGVANASSFKALN